MKIQTRQSTGFTLAEMIIVLAIVTILAGLAIPASFMLFKSFESQSAGENLISAAMAAARSIAAKEQHYAGINFQGTNPQYMVFIIHDFNDADFDSTGYYSGSYSYFKKVKGFEPISLPNSIGVMDFNLLKTLTHEPDDNDILNLTTFSIIFSPSGKLVIRNVQLKGKEELSRNSFVIYDSANTKLEYLRELTPLYINSYTGTIIKP